MSTQLTLLAVKVIIFLENSRLSQVAYEVWHCSSAPSTRQVGTVILRYCGGLVSSILSNYSLRSSRSCRNIDQHRLNCKMYLASIIKDHYPAIYFSN